jgi:hypothetical protein
LPSLARITYISWSSSSIILHSASVLNLDRKFSMQEKSLGFKTMVGSNLCVYQTWFATFAKMRLESQFLEGETKD